MPLTRRARIVLIVLCSLLLLGGLALLLLYQAARQVPDFYREALALDSTAQRKASDQLVQNVAALNNSVRHPGRWEVAFSAEEINGWLAVELPRSNPPVLPPELSDPRVAIAPDGVTVAARAEAGGLSTVVSLHADVYLESPNVLAIRLRQARAGSVPWPLGEVLEGITKVARHADLQLQWRQADGDPVAVIALPRMRHQGKEAHLDRIKLEEGRIVIAGTTERK